MPHDTTEEDRRETEPDKEEEGGGEAEESGGDGGEGVGGDGGGAVRDQCPSLRIPTFKEAARSSWLQHTDSDPVGKLTNGSLVSPFNCAVIGRSAIDGRDLQPSSITS